MIISPVGFEIAKIFLDEGAKVVLSDIDASGGEAALRLLSEAACRIENQSAEFSSTLGDGAAIFVQCDVSVGEEVANLIRVAEHTYGSVHILFNGAEIMHIEDGDALSTSDDVWDLSMAINAKGVFYGCKFGIPAIRKAGGGSIINMASYAAKMGSASGRVSCTGIFL